MFNCVSGDSNPVSWGRSTSLWVESVRRRPYRDTLAYPTASFTLSRLHHQLGTALSLGLPAHSGDLLARLMGAKSRCLLQIIYIFYS